MLRVLTFFVLTSSLLAGDFQPVDSPFKDGREGLNIDYYPLQPTKLLSGEAQARATL